MRAGVAQFAAFPQDVEDNRGRLSDLDRPSFHFYLDKRGRLADSNTVLVQ
jgi:hypothetical protein